MVSEHIDGAPAGAKCPWCKSELMETPTYSCSCTGVRTHLYLCLRCVIGVWIRWTRDLHGRWLVVSTDKPDSKLVRAALLGLGWRSPRRPGRPDWTPPA